MELLRQKIKMLKFKHLIIASRLSKGKYQILVKDYAEIENAEPLKHIDDATKIIMRG